MEIRPYPTTSVTLHPLFREGGPMPAVYVRNTVEVDGFTGYNPQEAIELA